MSQGNVELADGVRGTKQPKVVRVPLRAERQSSGRSLEQRLGVRFPRALAAFRRVAFSLPTRSRLRRALLRRGYEQAVAAYNRKDYDVLLTAYGGDLEIVANAQMRALGLEPVYRGHEGMLRYHQRWTDEWGDWKMSAEEVIDLGDGHTVTIGRVRGQGEGSGAATDSDFGMYHLFSRGLIRHEQFCFDRDEALRAAGLAPSRVWGTE